MSNWKVDYSDSAKKDLLRLDGSQRILVEKAIKKVSTNPISKYEGGYGTPLGNHKDSRLSGYFKIKLKANGIRIIYELKRIDNVMYIIVIGFRTYNDVYKEADNRISKH